LVLIALAATIGWWVAQGGLTGRLIELERAEPQNARFEVDVNQADWPELAELPGIGPTLAHRIVDCRRVGGPYADYADMRRRVRGLGPKTLESIRPYLRPMPPRDSVAGE
jgi:competence protein ComEA